MTLNFRILGLTQRLLFRLECVTCERVTFIIQGVTRSELPLEGITLKRMIFILQSGTYDRVMMRIRDVAYRKVVLRLHGVVDEREDLSFIKKGARWRQ